MNKAVLVIDMPKSCRRCDLFQIWKDRDGDLVGYRCSITVSKTFDCDIKAEKPIWCPLKSVPAKYSTRTELYLIPPNETEERKMQAFGEGYIRGRNDCIDEITGETE